MRGSLKRVFLLGLLCCSFFSAWTQTKVSGKVLDTQGEPIAFANVLFTNTTEGTITDENGRFYLESEERYFRLSVSFLGYSLQEIELVKAVTYEMEIRLEESTQALKEVIVYTGKQSKKNNPAIDLLRKIWKNKKVNGLRKYPYYQYDKYEKIQFDLNSIDSSMANSRMFRGMEFIFDDLDTSRITGKTYLPFFLNEVSERVYGNNPLGKERVDVRGNKNSGFEGNQAITAFVEDLYSDYNIYDNYLKFFDKSFTSPLSRTGVDVYNYVLNDSAFIDNKWCYNIVYYPRRKNELTFKGDFWVNDSTYAIKKINLAVTKSANINWVKEIYIAQEFEVLNDSVFLLKRDYMLSDFSFSKKEDARGIYGKRTTVYDNYQFNQKKPDEFYKQQSDPYDPRLFNRDSTFWANARLEQLNKDEVGIFTLLDTLNTVPKFKTYYNLVSILGSGYIEVDKWNLDIGDVYSTFGNNQAEGIRLRVGGRTYFGQNDTWRLEGYTAYGFKDDKFKHGFSAKVLLDRKQRLILSAGNRRDIEQLGLSLTSTQDVLGRSIASSAIVTVGNNNRLTNINLSTFNLEWQPVKNFRVRVGSTFRSLSSALPDEFSLDYVDPEAPGGVSSSLQQMDLNTTLIYTPGRRTIGYGVEPITIDDPFPTFLVNYSKGVSGFLGSDFNYERVQLSITQPWQIGGFGRLTSTLELGKTYGEVPLGLLSVIPGNQTVFSLYKTFPNLDFYEFVTDTYATLHLEHNFNGRLFSRLPFLRKLNLREIVGFRAAWGELSQGNIALSAPTNIPLQAPSDRPYWEYSLGVGNIFKIFRLDFNFRGNYLDNPDARRFGVTGSFGFSF